MKPFYIFFSLVIIFAILLLNLNLTWADTFDQGLNKTGRAMGYDVNISGGPTLAKKIGQIVNILLGMVGVMFLMLLVYGADTWMQSRGDEEKVKKAQKIIVNACMGLVAILTAYGLTYLIGTFLSTGKPPG